MTHLELVNYLKNQTGVLNVVVDVASDAKLKKTGNPYLNNVVIKNVTLTGTMGKEYRKEMESNATPDQAYISKPRAWGTLINPYTIEHKGNYYLQMIVDNSSVPVYTIDGVQCDTETLKPWITDRTDKIEEVVIRDIKFDNIRNLCITVPYNIKANLINLSFIV
jgi:hypothetical protein